MTIKLGMHSGPQNCTYEELRRLWHIADSSGFYWVSIWDHFYDNPSPDGSGPCFEAVSTLMALAAETRNVRVGSLVFCMGYRHPAVLAKAAVTIDHVSNGRLELGLGAGWFEMEYNAFGIPFPPVKTRLDALEEGVQVIRSMFAQEKTTFVGEHYQLTDAYCSPRPVQQPPRIWVGGGGSDAPCASRPGTPTAGTCRTSPRTGTGTRSASSTAGARRKAGTRRRSPAA